MLQIVRQAVLYICLALTLSLCLFASSCISEREYVYFSDTKENPKYPDEIEVKGPKAFPEPTIQSNDVLSVTIQTLAQNGGNAPVAPSGSAQSSLSGFLVDQDGYIEIAQIGFVKVKGLTTTEAKELIKQKAKVYYNRPVVQVRIVNFEVMIMGDVGAPGPVAIVDEKASILDVIAKAGDLNATAKRQNILLQRTEGDVTKFVRLDIASSDIYSSPYFYVKQRDRIYVEQNRFKRQSSDNSLTRYLGYTSGLFGIVSLLLVFKVIRIY